MTESMNCLKDYTAEAIDFIKQHEPEEGYVCAFSGGKDSIVCLKLCQMAGVKFTPVYTCTRLDAPEVMRFIRREYPEVQWQFPKQSFYRLIQVNGPPTSRMRWCCRFLKKCVRDPRFSFYHNIMGIRAEESYRRSQLGRIFVMKKHPKYEKIVYSPIYFWDEWVVWEFIDTYHLPYPSLYDEGLSRIGCVICPFNMRTKSFRNIIIHKFEKQFKLYKHACKRWFDSKKAMGKTFYPNTDFDTFWDYYMQTATYYKETGTQE